jgi:hypothetical protein
MSVARHPKRPGVEHLTLEEILRTYFRLATPAVGTLSRP